MPTPTHSFLPQCPGPGPGRTGSTPHSSARPGMQRRTGSAEAADPARRGPGALGRSRRPGAGAGGRRGYPGSSCSTVREPHDAGLVRIQRLPLPGVRARSPVWRSEMRLSSRLERGLVERMVQNASESARIRPDPAQIAKLRRILDHPRADPSERGVTQTHFGPQPHPGERGHEPQQPKQAQRRTTPPASTLVGSSHGRVRRNAAQHHRRGPVRAEHRPERARPHDLRSRPVAWCSGCAVPSGGVMR